MSYTVMTIDNMQGFRPIDIATLIYVVVEAILVTAFMSARPGWYFFLGLYLSVAALVFMITTIRYSGPFWRVIRVIYPLLIISLLYEILKTQVFLIHGLPYDSQINSFEMAVLGFDSSFALQPYMTVWRNEIMSFFYMSYYFMVPAAVSFLAFRGEWEALEKMSLSACVTFYVCYLIFIFYPVLGPRIYLEGIYYMPFDGPLFTPIVKAIVGAGGLFGGAMPSSHCAVALVIIWYLIRKFRSATLPLLTVLTLLCVSTVYGRFHYVSDVATGLVIGAIVLRATSLWYKKFTVSRARDLRTRAEDVEPALEVGAEP